MLCPNLFPKLWQIMLYCCKLSGKCNSHENRVLLLLLDDYVFTEKMLKTLLCSNICYKITDAVQRKQETT